MNGPSSASPRGRVLRGLGRSGFALDRRNPVAIGSDLGCEIVIEGADPRQAELRWDAEEGAWFVHGGPAPGRTLRNGEPVGSSRLVDGDELEIAGVRIRYADGRLAERVTSARLRVSVRGVSATAGGMRRLQGISFEAEPGSFIAILGPSGCGKSTLIRRIAGLAPFEGRILFNGHDPKEEGDSAIRPLLAYLPQAVNDTLHAEMSVREAMDDFARCHLDASARPDFAKRLDDVGLAEKLDAPVATLSGGEKRRLALALALLREPQLLLLDEPTAGLDPAAESDIMELLRRIADQGRTVLCATHVLGSLDKCDAVLVLAAGGSQAFFGTPARSLGFFGAKDWREIYRRLQKPDATAGAPREPGAPPPVSDLPPAAARASAGRAFGATLGRLARGVAESRRNLAFVAGNPIALAAVLLVACWSMFDRGDLGTIYFCMSVAMFWLGLSGSVRNLVAERVPKRCLDRIRGMPPAPYFAAHAAFTGLSVALQALLFVLPVFLAKFGHGDFSMHALPPFWLVLTLVGVAGGSVGLFVSAAAKREIQAVWALPFVAILALFLSKPVLEGGRGEKPTGFLRAVEYAMPTLTPQTLLETSMDAARGCGKQSDAHHDNIRNFAAVALGYPALFLSLAFLLQNKREKEWDGR